MPVDQKYTPYEAGGGKMLSLPEIDFDLLRDYRLGRVRKVLADFEIDLAILTSPMSLQYALDFNEYQLFQSRILSVTGLVPAEGPITMCGPYNRHYSLVDAYLPSFAVNAFDSGIDFSDRARAMADYLRGILPSRAKIAVERIEVHAVQALMQAGFDVVDLSGPMELARSIKSEEEITLIRYAIDVASLGMEAMRSVFQPGITENQLFSELHKVNIAHGGRWTEGRMLCSGPRTNPWLQEATDRVINDGELMGFDTDMVGPFGYFADVSRTWLCGDGKPSAEQKDLYLRAVEEINHNTEILKPGLSFLEWTDRSFRQPDDLIPNRYTCLSHGAGMSDEWPVIYYRQDREAKGYDGIIEPGMVLCVESYCGRAGGSQGVKIEQCRLVTETGSELLSTAPLESIFIK